MANITTTGTTGYPAALDTRTTLVDGSSGDEIVANHPNGLGAAVIAIETELGVNPRGSAADVVARLNVSQNAAGAVTLGTAASTVGILPFNRGGLGQTVASTTSTADGYLVGFANGVLQPLTLTSGSNITAVATSGTWTLNLSTNAKLSGDIVQMVSTQVTGFTTTNGIIPSDGTPPTSSEGSSFGLTVDMKPVSAANTVYVRGDIQGSSGPGTRCPWALFLGTSTSAVVAGQTNGVTAQLSDIPFLWRATTVSEATTTYTLRLGNATAGTFTLNGEAGGGLYGNIVTSILTVYEVEN